MADEVGLFAGMGVGVGFEKSMGKVKKQMTGSIAGVVKDMQKKNCCYGCYSCRHDLKWCMIMP